MCCDKVHVDPPWLRPQPSPSLKQALCPRTDCGRPGPGTRVKALNVCAVSDATHRIGPTDTPLRRLRSHQAAGLGDFVRKLLAELSLANLTLHSLFADMRGGAKIPNTHRSLKRGIEPLRSDPEGARASGAGAGPHAGAYDGRVCGPLPGMGTPPPPAPSLSLAPVESLSCPVS